MDWNLEGTHISLVCTFNNKAPIINCLPDALRGPQMT